MSIFGTEAPKYWEKGLSAIPLMTGVNGKRPFYPSWQQWAEKLPDENTQKLWLSSHANNNIGLALGPQSNIVIVDIDVHSKEIEEIIMSMLPKSPWYRVGSKGCALAYRYAGEKSFSIDSKHHGRLLDFLSAGRQIVLPPSIHPVTEKPYQSNVPLYEVSDSLPLLGDDLQDRLRAKLAGVIELSSSQSSKFKTSDYVGLGARDNSMVRYAGLLANFVMKSEKSLIEAVNLMISWCDNMVQKQPQDNIDVNKGVGKIVEFLKKDIDRGLMLPPGWDADLTPEICVKWGLDFNENQKEWTAQQLNDYINDEFLKIESPTDERRGIIVKYVLERMAKSQKLSKIDEASIIKNLKDNSGLGISIAAYNKELNELKKGPVSGESHDEIAQAAIKLYEERKGQLAYNMEKLWEWTGSHWKIIKDDELWTLITNEFGNLNLAKRASDHRGIIEVIKRKVQQGLTKQEADGVNFNNGFLTPDLKLMEHHPDHGKTYVLDFAYTPETAGACPRFMQYLYDVWGHHEDYQDKIQALREAIAVTVFGKATALQRAFLLYDAKLGGTGKSQLAVIIGKMVPEYAQSAIKPDKFHDKYSLGELQGKLFNFAGEISETRVIDGSSFKAIVAGDSIQGEHKYMDLFKYKPTCAHWFCGNVFPKTKDTSHGFNRRWLIFTFDKIIDKQHKVLELGESIANEEIEAIVAWAVECFPELIRKGDYTEPKSHLKAVEQMAMTNSPIRQWFSERIEKKPGNKVHLSDLNRDFFGYQAMLMSGKHTTAQEFDIHLCQILQEHSMLEAAFGEKGKIFLNIGLKGK